MYRITLTALPVNAAATIVFLATGEKKATVLKEVLLGEKILMNFLHRLFNPLTAGSIGLLMKRQPPYYNKKPL